MQLKIACGNTTLTNENFYAQSMELKEGICSENELRFGGCESSMFKIRIINSFESLEGKKIVVTYTNDLNDKEEKSLGTYYVDSDKPTADRKYRDIVAYDKLKSAFEMNVADWYVSVLPDEDSTVTLKQFRDSFFEYVGIKQENVSLANDNVLIKKTINPSEISGKDVLQCILEMNGVFGHIERNNVFRYVILGKTQVGLVPSNVLVPKDGLVPRNPIVGRNLTSSEYIKCEYEDFSTDLITKLQIRQKENDIGIIYGNGDNCYIVQDNFLVYGKTHEELLIVAENLYKIISVISYTPSKIDAIGNVNISVGDSVSVETRFAQVNTYIFERTLKGIQSLKDSFETKGTKTYSEKVNGVNHSIIQLRGKTNELERTVEETKSTITDVQSGLQSQITQTAETITTEVTRAKNAESDLSSKITQTAESITTKVTKGELSSEISQEAGQISITSNRLSLASDKCTITADGTLTAIDANLSGKITAKSGKIGGWTIGETSLFVGDDVTKSSAVFSTGLLKFGNGAFVADSKGNVSFQSLFLGNEYNHTISLSPSTGIISQLNIAITGTAKLSVDTTTELSKGKLYFGSSSDGEISGHGASIKFSSNTIKLSSTTLGFFGGNGSAKKTVSNITNPSASSTTVSVVATKLNDLLTALRNYGLIG